MNGKVLLMEKAVIDVPATEKDTTHIDLDCGGSISIKESPMEGFSILPSGNIQISGKTFPISR